LLPVRTANGGPPGSQGNACCCPFSLRPPGPRQPNPDVGAFPLVHPLFDQLFDRGSARHGVRRLSRLLQRGQGFPANSSFLVERGQQGRGPFLDPPALSEKHRPFMLRSLGQSARAGSAPTESQPSRLGVPKASVPSRLRQNEPPAGFRPHKGDVFEEMARAGRATTEMHASIEATAIHPNAGRRLPKR